MSAARLSRRAFCALAPLAAVFPVRSTALAGEPILVVDGKISRPNAGDKAHFDLAALEAMPKTEIRTKTIWTEGEVTFVGVALTDLLSAVGAKGTRLRAVALNDYAVEIPVSDAKAGGPIVAYLDNGKPMSVRERGPLWILYPFDDHPEYRTETIYSRCIWQLKALTVVD